MFSALVLVTFFSFGASSHDLGRVVGEIDRVEYSGGGLVISGWACQKGYNKPLSVSLYLGGSMERGQYPVKRTKASRVSGDSIRNLCGTHITSHRYHFYLNYEEMQRYVRKKIYVYGISVTEGTGRRLMRSGKYRVGIPYMRYTDSTLLRRNLNTKPAVTFDDNYLNLVSLSAGNYALKARYIPFVKGSERIVKSVQLSRSVAEATLSYDVKFDHDFEFVYGGKLHGLGGGGQASGCLPVDPKSWSVRVIFGVEGSVSLYAYHQDRVERCGDGYRGDSSFKFELDTWYRVELFVKLNSDSNNADGYIELFINGAKVVEKSGLRLTGDNRVAINKFKFNTFHGGSSTLWSPTKNVYAYFDNISVREGRKIYGLKGFECESKNNGIYSGVGACCSSLCGACGGAGCGQLNGESEACCTSEILNSAPLCSYPDQMAPCVL
ncbi:polysaccharide lyase [Microbulbifer sp. OS29]|uniref:Polysaccharide lyase n=1 Tax=Microbulbifer okhotskensis TaxID=2926617 RepID=A0A9X2EJC4_9GAMM|nr:polysaccharide lyase [Microbulbifer okhotskensis]MCO1333307.1 polysaccharide lyase [Microbulbifer okhotskensis]